MRTPIEALKEIRDRMTYFCLRTDGKYDPPWATEIVGIIDEAVTYSHAVGNSAAMREACAKMRQLLMLRGDGKAYCVLSWDEFNDSQKMLRAALSAPPRQCDVGTAEEQAQRFEKFCKKSSMSSFGASAYCAYECACKDCSCCELAWAQMPYEQEGGAK